MENQPAQENLSISRNAKIGLFHLGSGMADVLATGVWNRIMISDLGYSATPISLLLALRYFLTPLGLWSGRISDRRTVAGYRRLFWVWLGRAMMTIGVFGLGLATAELARGDDSGLMWVITVLALLLYSIGNAISGSTFLALVYDRAPEHQRGRAVGLVWAFLLTGFAFAGFFFGVLLPSTPEGTQAANTPSFTPETLQILFFVAALVLGALWFFPLLGEEKRVNSRQNFEVADEPKSSFRADMKLVWNNRTTRLFFWFLALSFIFVFAQDAILEPFGGDVFGIDAKHTTRFAAYWGSMAIISTLLFLWLPRRYKTLSISLKRIKFLIPSVIRRHLSEDYKWSVPLTNNSMAYMGVATIAVSYGLFAFAGLTEMRPLVTPVLILMGLGLGIWNVGTLGMMMQLSPTGRAGTFLGFWTTVEIISRGVGTSSGGIIRDVTLSLTSTLSLSYVAVFAISVVGLLAALWVLNRVNIGEFYAEYEKAKTADIASVFVGAMD
jgi:BCD family chlorophyll transporter-like MFS transporter